MALIQYDWCPYKKTWRKTPATEERACWDTARRLLSKSPGQRPQK